MFHLSDGQLSNTCTTRPMFFTSSSDFDLHWKKSEYFLNVLDLHKAIPSFRHRYSWGNWHCWTSFVKYIFVSFILFVRYQIISSFPIKETQYSYLASYWSAYRWESLDVYTYTSLLWTHVRCIEPLSRLYLVGLGRFSGSMGNWEISLVKSSGPVSQFGGMFLFHNFYLVAWSSGFSSMLPILNPW